MSQMQTPSSHRGRSREPRESFDDEDEDEDSFESFDSYASASDDDSSYEPISDRKLDVKESTEYESDGSYSDASDTAEPPTPDVTEYESDTSGGGGPNVVTRKHSPGSISSTSHEEFEDETEFEEDSDGEFGEDKVFDLKNSTSEDVTEDFDSTDEDESDGSDDDDDDENEEAIVGEEVVKMGKRDDDLFWKRYGYSQQMGTFGDESDPNQSSEDSSSQDSLDEESEDDSDFDDGDTFNNELYTQAFPSVSGIQDDDSTSKAGPQKKVRFAGSGNGFVEKIKVWVKGFKCFSCCDFSGEIFQGKFKWFMIGTAIFIVVGIILAIVMRKGDKSNTGKGPSANMSPTTTPSISSPPTLPPGQVMESITFFALIPDGIDDTITEEELEIEFSAAFDILAPQILINSTTLNGKNDADASTSTENRNLVAAKEQLNYHMRLRGRWRQKRRVLEALSVKLPVVVDIVELVCANTVPDPSSDMCVQATAGIILITDDGTIGFDYNVAVEDAIKNGQLQLASEATESNFTIVLLDEEDVVTTPSPTVTISPTNSPRPTATAAPTSSCYDKESSCEQWANQEPSECEVNPSYMWIYCVKACGFCQTESPTTASPTKLPSATPTALPTISATTFTSVSPVELVSESPSFSITGSVLPSISPAPTIGGLTTSKNETLKPTSSSCLDNNANCSLWATEGECNANPLYMQKSCAKSCNVCDVEPLTESPTSFEDSQSDSSAPTSTPTNDVVCVDDNTGCNGWAADGECSSNADWMLQNCKLSCNVCKTNENNQGGNLDDDTSLTLSPCANNNDKCDEWEADNQCSSNPVYMLENCKLSCNVCDSHDDDQSSSTLTPCADNNDKCGEWAADNQCSSNPSWMLQNCKLSCNVCDSTGNEQTISTPPPCADNNDKCGEWAADNQCSTNPDWMLKNCKLSCNVCGGQQTLPTPPPCVDSDNRCSGWAADNQCSTNPDWMLKNCESSCGVCENSDIVVRRTGFENSVVEECKDLKESCHKSSDSGECLLSKCAFWASEGECKANPSYMLKNCAKSCGSC